MSKKVAILLSAYNGEKYIVEQIDSLLRQTYENIEIFVRDDGSADGTLGILKGYEKKGQIKLFQGENLGFIESFFELLKSCGNADYYAFCDQDDIWLDEKIELAVKKLNSIDQTVKDTNTKQEANSEFRIPNSEFKKPFLYFSDYDLYDSDMNFVSSKRYNKKPTFKNSLFDCIGLGITMIFNKRLRDIIAEDIPKHSCGHDWWAYILCNAIGVVVHDPVSTVKYRRHGSSESSSSTNFIKFLQWRIKKFIENDYFKNIKLQMQELERLYGNSLPEDDLKFLRSFASEKRSFARVMKKVFYPRRLRDSPIDEILLRAVFLFGFL